MAPRGFNGNKEVENAWEGLAKLELEYESVRSWCRSLGELMLQLDRLEYATTVGPARDTPPSKEHPFQTRLRNSTFFPVKSPAASSTTQKNGSEPGFTSLDRLIKIDIEFSSFFEPAITVLLRAFCSSSSFTPRVGTAIAKSSSATSDSRY